MTDKSDLEETAEWLAEKVSERDRLITKIVVFVAENDSELAREIEQEFDYFDN